MTRPNPDAMKDFYSLEEYEKALDTFADKPSEQDQENLGDSTGSLVHEYFCFVAAKGATFIKWSSVRPAFIWKLRATMDEMHAKEAEKQGDDEKRDEFLKNPVILKQKSFILGKANEFVEGPPFTVQRICELLTTPTRHYKNSVGKFLRALERSIDVVTEVTERGDRITGAPAGWIPEGENRPPLFVEKNFIVPISDEGGESNETSTEETPNGKTEEKAVSEEAKAMDTDAVGETSGENTAET